MTYKINGTELEQQPTAGRWLPRRAAGIDGDAHAIYPAVRQFEISWNLMTFSAFDELHDFYVSSSTGTVIVDLPEYAASAWGFTSYTGCVLREPEIGQFFQEHISDVTLLIVNVRT